MKSLSHVLFAGMVGLSSVMATSAHAQAQAATASTTDFTEAEVRKVDKDNKKVTLKHGEIKNLDMPAMTMVFQVKDATELDKVKPGDKVRFKAANEGGKYTVMEIQQAK
ncbi:copper-binding protein [Caenimonas soli]|uniref:copper-binding protein n=1 Tax=Caenimonas soli TaxID=2735555 RepID=UPI00155641C4|nr:copper-binding protein [Caenimonas soli]NPC55616.1 copper-binding protein [Caenimonas soli]